MKAIGKGSLASILSAGLHLVRLITFAVFVGLAIAAVVMPAAPLIIDLARNLADGRVHAEIDIDAGDYVKLLSYLVAAAVTLYIVNRLLEILRTLRFGSPFVRENADRFKQVGYALLLGEAAKIVFGFLGLVAGAELEGGLNLNTWVAIIAVFVLAEVFLEGAKMKEEQDLTV